MIGPFRRGVDGYPEGADAILREALGRIPDSDRFLHHRHERFEPAACLHGWYWSEYMQLWGAHVAFADGWAGMTWPEPSSAAMDRLGVAMAHPLPTPPTGR